MQTLLEIDNISCRYDDNLVVDGLSLNTAPGSRNCLLGPSGCGKTTALRAIAGFQELSNGTIRLAGNTISSRDFSLAPEKRGLGMVFQDYALFPHLTIIDNIVFGLRRLSKKEQLACADEMLELVGLEGYGKRYPHELSGGQQQRIALARALAPRPGLILLDEPFSNLDVDLRERLASDVRDILIAQGIASIFVTHDQHEAFIMGEHIGILREGRLQQWDSPFNLYHEPVNRFVADFVGQGRLLRGRLVEPDKVDTPLGTIHGNRAYNWPKGSGVEILIRPDDIIIDPTGNIEASVTDRAFRGAETLYTLELQSGEELLSLMPSNNDFSVGQRVMLRQDVDHLVAFQQ